MKYTFLTMVFMLTLAGPFSVIAQEQPPSDVTVDVLVGDSENSSTTESETRCPMHNKGMMHKHKCHHDKGRGGMKHHCKHDKKGKHERHQRVVQRLDMIEARLAKIEAMLESLMRR